MGGWHGRLCESGGAYGGTWKLCEKWQVALWWRPIATGQRTLLSLDVHAARGYSVQGGTPRRPTPATREYPHRPRSARAQECRAPRARTRASESVAGPAAEHASSDRAWALAV